MTASHTYTVILEPLEEGGFLVQVPAFPEIWAESETEEEALAAAKEAIERVIAGFVERGATVPPELRKPLMREVTVSSAG